MVLERSLIRARKTVLLGPWLGGQAPAASTALWELPACLPSAPPLCALPGSLMDKKGKILIPGISEAVAPVTEEELALYDKIDFDLDEYTRDVGAETLLHGCKVLPPHPPPPQPIRPQGLPTCPAQGTPVGRSPRCRQRLGQVLVSWSPRLVQMLESGAFSGLELGGF